jgi:hypothetical protein
LQIIPVLPCFLTGGIVGPKSCKFLVQIAHVRPAP